MSGDRRSSRISRHSTLPAYSRSRCSPYVTRESLLASPPGVTAQVHSKFRHEFTATIPDAAESGLSMTGKAGAETAQAAALAHASSTLLRGTTPGSTQARSAANSVSRSIYGVEMANYYTEGPQLRACTEEELRTAFSLVAEKVPGSAESGRLPISVMRRVLSAALHQEPSRRQAEVLETELAVSARVEGHPGCAPAQPTPVPPSSFAGEGRLLHRGGPPRGRARCGGLTRPGP